MDEQNKNTSFIKRDVAAEKARKTSNKKKKRR